MPKDISVELRRMQTREQQRQPVSPPDETDAYRGCRTQFSVDEKAEIKRGRDAVSDRLFASES